MLVEWDLFHLVSLVFEKTIADIPCASEIFEVSQSLGALFGVGDGRVILRGAADQIGEKAFACARPRGFEKGNRLGQYNRTSLEQPKNFSCCHACSHCTV